MKKLVYPFCFFALLSGNQLFAQTSAFSNEFASVRTDLVSWDKVRGEWLAQSMEAMSNNQPVPDRNFPENFTPSQMFMAMPETVRSSVKTKIARQATSSVDSTARHQWSSVNQFVQRPTCSAVTGRTHGDPHLTSFDGAGYDFQTVGEFTLVKSQSGHMIVQVRQRPEGSSVSLNSAVAMWVNGDRVCFYAGNGPDGNRTTPIRVDGEAVYTNNGIFFLNHGGTITQSKSDYVVTWPTGERVVVDQHGFGNGDFFNLAVEVFPCNDNYTGILGNANGRSSDDFDINGRQANINFGTMGTANAGTQVAEREYLSYLSKDFARSWRITQMESLFDYGFGQSTASFTDESFPLVNHTIADLPQTDRTRAQRDCERQGFTGAALNSCIYDNGFLRIPPTPAASVPVAVVNPVVTPVVNPVPNVNPGGRMRNVGSTRNPATPNTTNPNNPIGDTRNPNVSAPNSGTTTATATKNPGTDPNSGAQPIDQNTAGGTSTKESTGTISSGTTTTTATKQPNPYEPPIEPERKRVHVGSTSTNQSSGTSSGSSSSGSSGSGSSSSGSSSSHSSSGSGSGSSGGSVRTSVPHTTTSSPKVSTPAPTPKPISTPKPAGGMIKKP